MCTRERRISTLVWNGIRGTGGWGLDGRFLLIMLMDWTYVIWGGERSCMFLMIGVWGIIYVTLLIGKPISQEGTIYIALRTVQVHGRSMN